MLVRVSGKFSSHYFTSVRVATMRSTIKSSFFNLTLHDQLSMYTYSQFSALLLTILIQVKQIWETTVINDIVLHVSWYSRWRAFENIYYSVVTSYSSAGV